MGTPSPDPAEEPVTEADRAKLESADASPVEPAPPESPSATDAPPAAARRRGLWSMMAPADLTASPSSDARPERLDLSEAATHGSEPASDASEAESASPNARGLFALMQRAELAADADPADFPSTPASNHDASATPHDEELSNLRSRTVPSDGGPHDVEEWDEDEDPRDQTRVPRPEPRIEPINLEELEPARYRRAAEQSRRQGRVALAAGVASVLASALTLLPHAAAGVPATLLGFVALIAGALVLTGAGRSEVSRGQRVTTILGMALGTAGVFLGPLLLAGIGRSWRDTSVTVTTEHLALIGQGLDQYYGQTQKYPIGGTFGRDDTGVIRGQHGWMTSLLPFVGETELYHRIDLSVPYDAESNRPAMGTSVPAYQAVGADRGRVGNGFAVSHFSGVGGEIDDGTGLAHLGIFERDAAVTREEVTDGLSNTLIVGELAAFFPPWGDPENWRQVGRGLNRELNGFGSVNGRGATFLLGDGSVRYFPNKTDPRVLQSMSTRNGTD